MLQLVLTCYCVACVLWTGLISSSPLLSVSVPRDTPEKSHHNADTPLLLLLVLHPAAAAAAAAAANGVVLLHKKKIERAFAV